MSDLMISDQDTGIHITGGHITAGEDNTKITVNNAKTGLWVQGDTTILHGGDFDNWSFNDISDWYIRLTDNAFYSNDPVQLDAQNTVFDGRLASDLDFDELGGLMAKMDDYKYSNQQLGKIYLGEEPLSLKPTPPPSKDDKNSPPVNDLPEFQDPDVVMVINEAFRMPRKYSGWAEDISTPPTNNVTEIRIGNDLNDIAPASGNRPVTCQSGGYSGGGQVIFGPMPICN